MDILKAIATELGISQSQVDSTVKLIDEGNTIPFIARYRKEATGGLSDVLLRDLYDRLTYLRNLEAKKEEVRRLIDEQGKLTDDLVVKISNAQTITEVDDIYRPYRPKRRTRATIAKEKGLELLAEILFAQNIFEGTIDAIAQPYIDEEKGVNSIQEALDGAKDIIAEMISDNADYRKQVRSITFRDGLIVVKATKDEKSVYEMYYQYSEAIKRIAPHRVLAINRGEREEFLNVKIDIAEEGIISHLSRFVMKSNNSITSPYVYEALVDGYKRLIAPSIEREIRNDLTEKAEEQAIKVFAANLKNLLLQPPVKGKVTMGFDPAYRTGCKIAVVDETGKLLETTTIYPTAPQHAVEQSKDVLKKMISKYSIDMISIGNGTASRESEDFVAGLLKEVDRKVYYMVVSEAGASVYSASKLASEEYPDINVSLRGAISIGRRLQDPLAELVKIDPKHVGVGQYQHDVNQKRLEEALKGVVEDAVNSVGVDLNTASASLLSYVSGINASVAKNIVAYREEKGRFNSREEIKKVKRLGDKVFTQCAGFLRISEGENILDNTSVHPESYDAAIAIINKAGLTLAQLKTEGISRLIQYLKTINSQELAKDLNIGLPTLLDIMKELEKPGRDPRDEMPKPIFMTDVLKIEDLKKDMILTGTVRNVIDFGAFVDIGVHQDGLVHISQISDKFIKNPMEVLSVGDIVKVKVMDVDVERGRISLTMKGI